MVFYVVINDTGENFISGDEEALDRQYIGVSFQPERV